MLLYLEIRKYHVTASSLIDIELMSEYSIQCCFYVASLTPFRGTRHCMQTAQSFNDFEIINGLLIINELL